MFSFTKGRPIARIKGGEFDGKILKLIEDDVKIDDMSTLLKDPFFNNKKKRLSLKEITELRKTMRTNDLNKDLLNIYCKSRKELLIEDGKLIPLPSEDIVERLYIAGASGSGKSTFAASYIREYKKMCKDCDVYLFSRIEEDDKFKKLDIQRIEINEELLEDKIEAEELKDSVVMFDDVDTLKNKELKNEILSIREDLLECGRHFNIRIIATSHNLLNFKQTRNLLNEATSVVFFPKGGGGTYQIKGFLKRYAGLDSKEILKIMKFPSRWISLYRSFPMYIIHERGAMLI